jgi:dienelactone hydrolase
LGLSRTFDELATFTGGPLLSRVEREIAAADTSRLGIGGASLGGLAAIEVMARFPARFAAAAVVQPALETSPAEHFATRMIAGGKSGFRATVITSRGDPFRKVSDALAAALAKKGIDATLRVSKGAHDAAFLREVGCLEMTFALERALG